MDDYGLGTLCPLLIWNVLWHLAEQEEVGALRIESRLFTHVFKMTSKLEAQSNYWLFETNCSNLLNEARRDHLYQFSRNPKNVEESDQVSAFPIPLFAVCFENWIVDEPLNRFIFLIVGVDSKKNRWKNLPNLFYLRYGGTSWFVWWAHPSNSSIPLPLYVRSCGILKSSRS